MTKLTFRSNDHLAVRAFYRSSMTIESLKLHIYNNLSLNSLKKLAV